MMTTNKERAERMRKAAYHLQESGHKDAADVWRRMADELDPPKPEWPDGTIAVVTYDKGDDYARDVYARRSNGKWREADSAWFCFDNQVTSVTPLRVLGDDEIAVKRTSNINPEMIDTLIDCLSHCGNISHRITRDVLGLVRDALEAEAT